MYSNDGRPTDRPVWLTDCLHRLYIIYVGICRGKFLSWDKRLKVLSISRARDMGASKEEMLGGGVSQGSF